MCDIDIQVHVRRTGDMVSVSVSPLSTTFAEILNLVCERIKEPYPEDYYLIWNRQIELENDQIIQPKHLNGYFQMIMRTNRFLEYIAGVYRVKEMQDHPTISSEMTSEFQTIDQPVPDLTSPPEPTLKAEVRKSILGDVVQSAIAKVPRQDVQQYLHGAVGKSFDILLMGSPRVGKSTLINSILRKEVAKISAGRNACTDVDAYYEYQETYTTITNDNQTIESTCSIRIWDAPGIENWTKFNVSQHIRSLLGKTNPICLIYCASPGAYAEMVHLQAIVKEFKALKLFIALVVTNMFASDEADDILRTFQHVLAEHSPLTKEEAHVYHYGPVGLFTQVNSVAFTFGDVTMQPTGIDELMIGIMQSLSEKKMLQWCFALMDNGPFWVRAQATLWRWVSSFKNVLNF